MSHVERLREEVASPPSSKEIQHKAAEGWTLVAVEWQRETTSEGESMARPGSGDDTWSEPTPFGAVTAAGDTRLRRDSAEEEVLRLLLALVTDDRHSLPAVAEELNRRGFRTRRGTPWSPSDVFNLMPRLVEVAPRIFARSGWSTAGQGAASQAVTH